MRLITGFTFLVVLLAPQPSEAAIRFVGANGNCFGRAPCFSDLQTAIDASTPDDTIYAFPGHYSPENPIRIPIPITIFGPKAAVSPMTIDGTTRVPGDPTTEAIFDGSSASLSNIFILEATPITLDGLEIVNALGDIIVSEPSAFAGALIRSNLIHGSSGGAGIRLQNILGCVLSCNRIFDVEHEGFRCDGSTSTVVIRQEIHDVRSSGAAVYLTRSSSTFLDAVLVRDIPHGNGITIGNVDGSDVTFTEDLSVVYASAIVNASGGGVFLFQNGSRVLNSEIANCGGSRGGIVIGHVTDNIFLAFNRIRDNVFSTAGSNKPAGIVLEASVNLGQIGMEHNDVFGNQPFGVANDSPNLHFATNFWWGDASGPSGAGSGSGDAVSNNLSFDPWLTEPVDMADFSQSGCGLPPVQAHSTSWGRVKSIYR